MAVNNTAAAVMLALMTVCKDKEVIVSRGELVEIGGSFRVPDIMSMSGAILREVGTTNKTRLPDYKNAVTPATAALLKVHTSNFKILGFSQHADIGELSELSREVGLPVIYDLGSGLIPDGDSLGLNDEVSVPESIMAGADVVCFSADKLFGGPQAGIIAGRKKYIDCMKKHQFARAVRIDKLTLAALEGTLRIYSEPKRALIEIPVLKNLTASVEELKARAKRLCGMLKGIKEYCGAEVMRCEAPVGGGSAPGESQESYAVELSPLLVTADELERGLRAAPIPVIARIRRDKVLLDVRTIPDFRFKDIEGALTSFFKGASVE
jgi:L-seryl-tRNA(Ser) seleniumtransferase